MSKETKQIATDTLLWAIDSLEREIDAREIVNTITAHVLDELAYKFSAAGQSELIPETESPDPFPEPAELMDPALDRRLAELQLPPLDFRPFIADAAPARPLYAEGLLGGGHPRMATTAELKSNWLSGTFDDPERVIASGNVTLRGSEPIERRQIILPGKGTWAEAYEAARIRLAPQERASAAPAPYDAESWKWEY